MARIRRRAYGPKTEEQRNSKYGRRVGSQTGGGQRAYQEKSKRKRDR